MAVWWLGSLGRLRALPPVRWGDVVDAPEVRIGGEHVSLTGRTTTDVVAHRMAWAFHWPDLAPADLASLRAMWLGLADGPLRIIDPRQPNRLTRDGAAGGSYTRTAAAHTVSGGTRTWATVTDYPDDLAGLVGGCVSWAVPATSTPVLLIDDGPRIPLVPGEQITVSILLAGSENAQVGVQFYDTAGADAGTSVASAVTLGTWAWVSHTITPSSGQVAASLGLLAASGSARTIRVGPAQWEPGPARTTWSPGSGCPEVEITGLPTTWPDPTDQTADLTVREV